MDLSRFARDLANVCNLSTPLGLLLGFAGRGKPTIRNGLLVFEGVRLPAVKASAMAVGSVILILNDSLPAALNRLPTLLEHEEEHTWQWAYCLGLPFLPLYLAATLRSLATTGDRGVGNFFERQAGLNTGGYLADDQP